MIGYKAGGLVRSLAGHDKDQYFIILEESGEYISLVDGKSRKLEKPKRKNKKHVQLFSQTDESLGSKLIRGEPVTNEEIRGIIRNAVRLTESDRDDNKRNHRAI